MPGDERRKHWLDASIEFPARLLKDLFSTTIARSVHREIHQTAYFSECDCKRKAKEAAKYKDNKNKKNNKNRALAHHQTTPLSFTTPTPPTSTDVVISEVVDTQQPSTSSTVDKVMSGTYSFHARSTLQFSSYRILTTPIRSRFPATPC